VPPVPTMMAINSAALSDTAPWSRNRSRGRSDRGSSLILNGAGAAGPAEFGKVKIAG
jgi:hypothetical protein